jgi:hypothetical protein
MTYKIIITSVGSLVGQNILDSLDGRRGSVFLTGTNSLATAPNNFRCDKAVLVPEASRREAYRSGLLELFERERPDLVIPARDDDITVLAELALERPEWASRLLVGSLEMARVMDDKVASHDFAVKHDLPFVETVNGGRADSLRSVVDLRERYGFPLIAKPRSGNGSRGIRILTEEAQLHRAAANPDLAIQPMLDPPAEIGFDPAEGLPLFWGGTDERLYGVQSLIDPQGLVHIVIGFMSTMVSGRCELMRRCDAEGLLDAAHRFSAQAARQGWRGPINIQFKDAGARGFLAIELNGRFTGGTSTRTRLGSDEVGECINAWLGDSVIPPLQQHAKVHSVSKSLCDFPVLADDYVTLSERKTWTRSC